MMTIWGRIILVDLETILDDLQMEAKNNNRPVFDRILQSSNDIFIQCPNIEAHGNELERTPSCSVNKETGVTHCFGCGYSDSLPGLISRIMGFDNKVLGYRWLLRGYTTPVRGSRPLIKLEDSRSLVISGFLPESCLDRYQYDHPYMFKRGLNEDLIDLFDLGFDRVTNSITIPMRDHKGRIVFIKKRPISKLKFHKYHIDEGVDKRGLLFGLNLIAKNISQVKMVYLCEGEFDVISLYGAKKYGAGVQGDRMFSEQVKQLIRVAKGIPVCILMDNDNAGRKARLDIIDRLRGSFPLYEGIYPVGGYKDPNDLYKAGLLENLNIKKVL